jgi:hypothetical protein
MMSEGKGHTARQLWAALLLRRRCSRSGWLRGALGMAMLMLLCVMRGGFLFASCLARGRGVRLSSRRGFRVLFNGC